MHYIHVLAALVQVAFYILELVAVLIPNVSHIPDWIVSFLPLGMSSVSEFGSLTKMISPVLSNCSVGASAT
jgi:hypothetical protein